MPTADARRRLRPRHKVLLVLAAAVAGLLALEAAVRVRHWLKHGSFTAVYDFTVDEASGLRIPRPGTHGNIVCDRHGFRSPEPVTPKPEGTVRIAFLGGSTTFCAEASSNAATWPALVVERLREAYPDRRFDWINAAGAGYAVSHSLDNLRHRVAPHRPDVVVVYHGTNDLAQDTRALATAAGLLRPGDDEPGFLERHSMLVEILRKNLAVRSRSGGPGAAGKLEIDAPALAKGFEARLTELVGTCREAGARLVVLVTFSHRVRPEQDAEARRAACESALYYMPFLTPDAILAGITAYNEAVARVAAATGAVLVGGEQTIPADGEHFNNSVHFRDAGCRVQAERVVRALLAPDVGAGLWR